MAEAQTDANSNGNLLDLTTVPERPTVRLPGGDYEMRRPEELTFQQFGALTSTGREIRQLDDDDPDVIDKLRDRMLDALSAVLVDFAEDDEAAQQLTPGNFGKIVDFFNRFQPGNPEASSEPGSSSAPDASASTEASETG